MPAKGDDIDSTIANALTEHLSNVDFLFTPAGDPHPSSSTLSIRGNFNNEYEEVSGMEDNIPTVSFETRLLSQVTVSRDGQIGIVGGFDYLVVGIRPTGRGRTLLVLRKRDAQT